MLCYSNLGKHIYSLVNSKEHLNVGCIFNSPLTTRGNSDRTPYTYLKRFVVGDSQSTSESQPIPQLKVR